MRASLPFVLVLAVVPAAAQGQTCLGQTSYDAGAVRVGVGGEFGNGRAAVSGGAALGKPQGLFGGGSLGLVRREGQTGLLVSAFLGTGLKKPIVAKLEVCPMAVLRFQFGPMGFYERNYLVGVMAGYPIPTSSTTFRMVIAGGWQGAYQQYGFNGDNLAPAGSLSGGGGEFDYHEWHALLDAGVGFIFNDRFSLVPQIRIPLWYSFQDASFLIRANLNLGKVR